MVGRRRILGQLRGSKTCRRKQRLEESYLWKKHLKQKVAAWGTRKASDNTRNKRESFPKYKLKLSLPQEKSRNFSVG
jgi:hypothetical protein